MHRNLWRPAAVSICLPVALCAFLVSGCGGDAGPKVVPVVGTVTVDGSPLATANVSFKPDITKGNKAQFEPGGTANDKGQFELTTANKPGAPEGWYKVVVYPPTPPRSGGDLPKVGPPPFNVKYTDAGSTDISIEIKAGAAAGAYDLKLTK